MRSGALLDAWRVVGPDGLLWADALALPDDPGEALAAPFGFAGAEGKSCGASGPARRRPVFPQLRGARGGGRRTAGTSSRWRRT